MFVSKNRLGFEEDDLDLSPDAQRRRATLENVGRSVRNFRLAIAIVLVPCFLAVLIQTIRDDQPNRWVTFGVTTAILLFIAVGLELTIVRPQKKQGRKSVRLD